MTDYAATQTDDQTAAEVVLAHSGHTSVACAEVQVFENAEQNLIDAGLPHTYADCINAAIEYLRTVAVTDCPFCS